MATKSYQLRPAYVGNYGGGQISYGHYGNTFDVGAALTAGGGTITTSDDSLADELDAYPPLFMSGQSGILEPDIEFRLRSLSVGNGSEEEHVVFASHLNNEEFARLEILGDGTINTGDGTAVPALPVPISGAAIIPVATIADLPSSVTPGSYPIYLVISVPPTNRPVLYAWDGLSFVAVGSGGGGGGVGPGGTVLRNLFVQQTEPTLGDIFLDSLWIATNVDGTAKDLSFWEVYTGTGDGDGGNLILAEERPNPVVNALWIPLNPDGTPLAHTEWEVFTGRGSQLGIGNDNVFIQATLPGSPPVGSLFIPLNSDETPKSMELWRVNT